MRIVDDRDMAPRCFSSAHVRSLRARVFSRPALAAAIITFIVGAIPLVLGLVPVGLDFSRIEIPMLCELQHVLASGSRLWLAPHFGNGASLYAHPHAQLLYPLRWMVVFLDPETGASLGALLHLCIAAAGCASLARSFGVRRETAALAGVTYALSGVTLDLVLHASYIAGGAWLPVIWASARALLSTRSVQFPQVRTRAILGVTAAVALALLAGEPQSVLVAAALIGVDATTTLFRRWHRARNRVLLHITFTLLCGVAGACVGGLLWLPALADMGLGSRGLNSLEIGEVLINSFGLEWWPALVVPGLIVDVGHDLLSYGKIMGQDEVFIWNTSPFVASPLLLALPVAALVKRVRVTALVACFLFLMAAGSATPFLPTLMRIVPSLASFRYPAKYLVPFCLVMIVVGAVLIDVAKSRADVRRALSAAWILLALVLAGFVVALSVAPEGIDSLVGPAAFGSLMSELQPFSTVLRRGFAIAALAPLLAFVFVSMPALRRHTMWSVVITTIAFAPRAIPFTSPVLEKAGALDLLSIDREDPVVFCVSDETRLRVVSSQDEGWDRGGEAIAAFVLGLSEAQACYGLSSPVEYGPSVSRVAKVLQANRREFPSIVARAVACDRVITSSSVNPPGLSSFGWQEIAGVDTQFVDGLRVLAVDDPVPLAFVAVPTVVARDEQEVVRALLAGVAPTSIVDVPSREGAQVPTGMPLARALSMERDGMDRITLHIDGTGRGVVGVRQSYRIGFSAMQGDRSLPLVRIGGMFLGAVVDDLAGGPVVFRYRPPRLVASYAFAISGVLLFMVTLRISLRASVRNRRP
jgi:hypothetical protein